MIANSMFNQIVPKSVTAVRAELSNTYNDRGLLGINSISKFMVLGVHKKVYSARRLVEIEMSDLPR